MVAGAAAARVCVNECVRVFADALSNDRKRSTGPLPPGSKSIQSICRTIYSEPRTRRPPSPLSEPLLAQPYTSEPAESNDEGGSHGSYTIKGVRGLWWRQSLLLAQAALQLTLLVYALATGGEGTYLYMCV